MLIIPRLTFYNLYVINSTTCSQRKSYHGWYESGDQGDQKILPEEGSGKEQKRDYIDTMSKKDKTIFLIENKETWSKLIKSKDVSRSSRLITVELLACNLFNAAL